MMSSEANTITENLRTLHRIHRQLRDLKGRLQRGPRIIVAHDANVQKLETQLAAVKEQARALKFATDEKQNQLATREAMVEKRRGQLRQASDNREYQALKEQIAADEMSNSVLTDELLEAMEKLDGLNKRVAEAEAALAHGKQEARKAHDHFENESPAIHGDIERLKKELADHEAVLPADYRDIYHRAVRGKGEEALAPVVGEYCGGCNQHIPLNEVNKVMLGQPIACRSCGRLLYIAEAAT